MIHVQVRFMPTRRPSKGVRRMTAFSWFACIVATTSCSIPRYCACPEEPKWQMFAGFLGLTILGDWVSDVS
jgi:hypothetical protein